MKHPRLPLRNRRFVFQLCDRLRTVILFIGLCWIVTNKANRDEVWLDFCGWRVHYDAVLLALARLTMAPPAPWTGTREGNYQLPGVLFGKHHS